MIRNRVEPKPLPNVKLQHLPGVFGEFDDIIDRQIAQNAESTVPFNQEKARFFVYLKQLVDAVKFGAMQEAQLAEGKLRLESDMVKYIDPTIWFERKLAQARRIGLHQRAPMKIMDIGTGPAHFPVVAAFYGHDVIGTDLPHCTTGDVSRGHLYDALGDIFRVRRIPLRIEPFTPLPPFGARYDLVTAFLVAFNVDAERKPWTVPAWQFFLGDLSRNVLSSQGELFLNLANGKLTNEVWDYLAAYGAYVDDKTRTLHILDMTPFAAHT